ncbi:MAG: hypothetical protein KDA96_12200, partial [Planctomycetaceae bacterium]|nr:hypothetical protein [Planctomycetaceae bacterium]
HYANGDEELYDTTVDRFEWQNLANDPATETMRTKLRQLAPQSFAELVAPTVESLPALPWHSITDGNAPPSRPDGNPFDVVFINRRNHSVKLSWMDRQGNPVHYAEIVPGAQQRQQTRPGAVWMITSDDGTPPGFFVVEDRAARAIIPAR